MSEETKLPSFEELFGSLNTSSGDEARSALSPASYFADLMQLKEKAAADVKDENVLEEIDRRRPDLSGIPLDREHTFTAIPYLDIVNAVMADKIATESGSEAYKQLNESKYPFTLPFSKEHRLIHHALDYHQSNRLEFYEKFISAPNANQAARDFLGITQNTYDVLVTPVPDDQIKAVGFLKNVWGLKDSEVSVLSDVETFTAKAGLTGMELLELLNQNLSDAEIGNSDPLLQKASDFYINSGDSYITKAEVTVGAVTKTVLQLATGQPLTNAHLDRIQRFIRLARITGWSFTDCDLVLRSACNKQLNAEAIQIIAAIKYLQDTYQLPLDTLCSFWATMKNWGNGTGSMPEHLFYRVFDKGYTTSILVESEISATALKNRLQACLALTELDLNLIQQAIGDSFPAGSDQRLAYLSVLYRFAQLPIMLGLSVAQLFTLLDIVDRMWKLQAETKFGIAIPLLPPSDAVNCRQILSQAGAGISQVLWLLQMLGALNRWLNTLQMSVSQLAFICSREIITGMDGVPTTAERDSFFAELADAFKSSLVQAGQLQSALLDMRSAQSLFGQLITPESGILTPEGIVRSIPDSDSLTATIEAVIYQKNTIGFSDFSSLGWESDEFVDVLQKLETKNYLHLNQDASAAEVLTQGIFTAHGLKFFTGMNPLTLDGYAETQTEAMFKILSGKAKKLSGELSIIPAETNAVVDKLKTRLQQQEQTVYSALEGVSQLSSETLKMLARVVYTTRDESETMIISRFLTPLLNIFNGDRLAHTAELAEAATNFHRLQQFILATKKAELTPSQVKVLLAKEDYLDRKPEKIVLPEWQAFDAVFKDVNGDICVTSGENYARYSGQDYSLLEQTTIRESKMSAKLPESFKAKIDTGLESSDGKVYLFSGEQFLCLNEDQPIARNIRDHWGQVDNNIARDKKVDAAYRAPNNKTYLFRGDQYVRYSDVNQAWVDEGYPKKIAANWNANEGQLLLPTCFNAGMNAAFTDHDKNTYFFGQGQFLSSQDPEHLKNISDYWGRVLNSIGDEGKVDAALVINDKTYLFRGDQYVRYSTADYSVVDTGYPRKIVPNWEKEGLGPLPQGVLPGPGMEFEGFTAGFQGPQGTGQKVYLFPGGALAGKYFALGETDVHSVNEYWGRVLNNLQSLNRVDAAFCCNGQTYLFSGDQYTRYQGALQPGQIGFYAAEGYPKKIKDNWNQLENLGQLPTAFTQEMNAALAAPDQSIYYFSGNQFINSQPGSMTQAVNQSWGRVRNQITKDNKVDAALVYNQKLFLFSQDQYVRYSQDTQAFVDEGYPKTIANNFKAEGGWPELPLHYSQDLQAALPTSDNKVYLFSGNTFVSSDNFQLEKPVNQNWGRVNNNIQKNNKVDCAFTALDGKTYVFSGNQFCRYSTTDYTQTDEG